MKPFIITIWQEGGKAAETHCCYANGIADVYEWAQRHWPGVPAHIRLVQPGETRYWQRRRPLHPQQVRVGRQRRVA